METVTTAWDRRAEVASHVTHVMSAAKEFSSDDAVNVSNIRLVSVFVRAAVTHVYACCCKHANLLLSLWAEDKLCRSSVNEVQLVRTDTVTEVFVQFKAHHTFTAAPNRKRYLLLSDFIVKFMSVMSCVLHFLFFFYNSVL